MRDQTEEEQPSRSEGGVPTLDDAVVRASGGSCLILNDAVVRASGGSCLILMGDTGHSSATGNVRGLLLSTGVEDRREPEGRTEEAV